MHELVAAHRYGHVRGARLGRREKQQVPLRKIVPNLPADR